MGRLHCVVLLTPDVERQRAFYADQLGLQVSRSEPDRTVLAARGAALVLRPQAAGAAAELRVAITATPLDARVAALRAKSARFEGDVSEDALARRALVRDPEGNLVELVEPREAFAEAAWPTLSHVIVSAAKYDETVAFYRELLGLKLADEDEDRWVEFDTGTTRLVVHERDDAEALPLHPDQRMAFAIQDADFDAWVDELRKRSVTFAAAPAEGELGPQAEIEDGDGWLVVLRGPRTEESLDEDELDAEYGDDDEPHGLPRRGGELSSDGGRRSAFNPVKAARKQAARTGKNPVEPERGGFVPRAGSGAPRPYSPRPAGPPGAGGPPRPFTPREGGPPRPFTPREGGPPRPFTPREGGPPREGSSRPYPPRSDAPRPSRPAGPPRPDRDRTE